MRSKLPSSTLPFLAALTVVALTACGGGETDVDSSNPGVGGATAGKSGSGGKAGGKAGNGGSNAGNGGSNAGNAGTGGSKAGSGGSNAGNAGTGGSKAGSGGSNAGNAGTGGSKAGSGGSNAGNAGTGGSNAGSGGSDAGNAGTGGSNAGSGGADAGAGGSNAGSGGADAGAGGSNAGSGGSNAGAGGSDAGAGGGPPGPCIGLADGSACDDGDLCTVGDSCQSEVCVAGAPVTCTASDDCHDAGACDPQTGACTAETNKPDGEPCDDGDLCTVKDQCTGGLCGGTKKLCAWKDACNEGICDITTGACTTKPLDQTKCGDGTGCTDANVCNQGTCEASKDFCGATKLVISEFRTRGPGGGNDEFVEIYNTTDTPIDLGGFWIDGSNNKGTTVKRYTFLAGTTIAPHGHILVAHTGYAGTVPPDFTYTTGITDDGGIALFHQSGTILDQVGMSTDSAYKEEKPLSPLTGTTDTCYERRVGSGHGNAFDSNDNAFDFVKISPCFPQSKASRPTPAFDLYPDFLFFPGLGAAPIAENVKLAVPPAGLTPLGDLHITDIKITGPSAAEFSATTVEPLPITVPEGAAIAITVTHTPASSGLRIAYMVVMTKEAGAQTYELWAGDAL